MHIVAEEGIPFLWRNRGIRTCLLLPADVNGTIELGAILSEGSIEEHVLNKHLIKDQADHRRR